MTRTLMIFQDSEDFGGHEAMFLRFLPAVIDSGTFGRIVLRHPAGNERFAERLRPFASPTFDARGWEFVKRRAEPYLAPLRLTYRNAVKRLLAKERPAVTLLLQGRIENCAVPMLANPSDGLVVSYIPMAHRMADLGRASFPGDLVRRKFYRRPNRMIVPGEAVADQVSAAGGNGQIYVAENVVAPPPKAKRHAARAALKIGNSNRVALFLGRMETRQKGLDLLFEAIRADAEHLGDWTFLFIGSGDAEADAAQLATEFSGRIDIRCIPWTDQPYVALAAADLMLMPSRWEGVPLVLLEAMTYEVPVLGSDLDVFRQYLPAENLTNFAHSGLSEAMNRVVEPAQVAAFKRHSSRILESANLAQSSHTFVRALSEGLT